MSLSNLLQILLIIFGPWLCIRFVKSTNIAAWLSPVVLSYGLGILLVNTGLLSINDTISTSFSEGTILLAIPMLLYATNLKSWFQQARTVILSFVLIVIAGVVASTIVALSTTPTVAEGWMLSGMLVGVYTGGTPNMQAVGIALDAGEDVYVLVNAADIFCSGIYLIFLTSVAQRLLGLFLPQYQFKVGQEAKEYSSLSSKINQKSLLRIIGLTILICGISVGVTSLVPGGLSNMGVLILLLTSLSIVASFVPAVRSLKGAYEAGEYLLLMFCVAIGMLVDLENLMGNGLEVIAYTGSVLLLTILLHYALSALFRIDRDTTMIVSTAAVFGPVFIGQIASALRNRELVFAGMVTGLAGYAIGNYLGLSVAWGLKYLLQ